MEYRQLGRSGLKVSTLTMGTMTFGGKGAFFVGIGVEVPEALHNQVVVAKYHLVHAGAVVVKFGNDSLFHRKIFEAKVADYLQFAIYGSDWAKKNAIF